MRVLIVVAKRYNGHELWTTLGILQQAEIEFEVISEQTLISDEITREANTIARTIYDVDPNELNDFDGLMFISGNMQDTESYWSNSVTLSFVDMALELDLVLAAICCSVPTIRNAAKDKRVSFYPLIRSRIILEDAGAICETISITVDGNLVTAEHQMATQTWAESFVKVLKNEPVTLNLRDSGFEPMGKTERRLHPRLERLRGTDTSYRDRDKDKS